VCKYFMARMAHVRIASSEELFETKLKFNSFVLDAFLCNIPFPRKRTNLQRNKSVLSVDVSYFLLPL